MDLDGVLDQPHLSLLSAPRDPELARIGAVIRHAVPIASRADLEELLGHLLRTRRTREVPKTLDLIGHSTPGSHLIELGSWQLDARNPIVSSYFRELAEHDVLPRLGVHAVRLIGSLSADTPEAQFTICTLSEILGLEVFGTKNVIFATHFDANGFTDDRGYYLARASDLRREPPSTQPLLAGDPSPRGLDVDALPALPLEELGAARWQRRFASQAAAHTILGLAHRHAGRSMPGMLAAPTCELVLPSNTPGRYHLAHVLLEGSWLRVYHDGPDAPGVCYAITRPRELIALVDELPQHPAV